MDAHLGQLKAQSSIFVSSSFFLCVFFRGLLQGCVEPSLDLLEVLKDFLWAVQLSTMDLLYVVHLGHMESKTYTIPDVEICHSFPLSLRVFFRSPFMAVSLPT